MLNRLRAFFKDVQAELRKVSWPEWRPFSINTELWGSTIIVLVVVVIMAALIGFFDFLFEYLLYQRLFRSF